MTVLGFLVLAVTLALAVAIGVKANHSVRTFDEAAHESFIGSDSSGG